MHMGGRLDRIEIHALMSDTSRRSSAGSATSRCSLSSLKAQFATFDAAKAQCFLPQDKHRLLAVVEAGFGDFKAFNARVRTAFAERLEARPSAGRGRVSKLFRSSKRLGTRRNFVVEATLASAGPSARASVDAAEPSERSETSEAQHESV